MAGVTVTGVLASGQARAESLMVDTCVVRRIDPDVPPTQDPDTGTESPAYVHLFTSKCKVQARALTALDAEVGGRTSTTVRLELHLPVSTEDLQTGDVAEITAAGSLSRTTVGRHLRITGPVDKSYPTALRYEVTEVVA